MHRLFFVLSLIFLYNSNALATTLTEENIKSFLEKNPSIILDILRSNSVELLNIVVEGSEKEAKQELEQQTLNLKAKFEAEKKNKTYPILVQNRPFIGNVNAPITLVSYSDFLCPYCFSQTEAISNLLAQNKHVRYIFKSYSKNPTSQLAYSTFLAVWTLDKKKAFELYAQLFTHQEELIKGKKQYLTTLLTQLGCNPDTIFQIAQSPAIQAILKEDMAEGTNLKVKGTPTTILNGKYSIVGAVPTEVLQYAVDFVLTNK